ncbi:MAG: hypothetical protein HC851_20510 [Acaryochloris sp. RU_4_1]|nr:hypothetical protein [Acaryochloris sp. RU_4_1]
MYKLEKAHQVAAELQAGEEDGWAYEIVDCKNGLGRIDIYDEERELVCSGRYLG